VVDFSPSKLSWELGKEVFAHLLISNCGGISYKKLKTHPSAENVLRSLCTQSQLMVDTK
jgi:hypothetical protein